MFPAPYLTPQHRVDQTGLAQPSLTQHQQIELEPLSQGASVHLRQDQNIALCDDGGCVGGDLAGQLGESHIVHGLHLPRRRGGRMLESLLDIK